MGRSGEMPCRLIFGGGYWEMEVMFTGGADNIALNLYLDTLGNLLFGQPNFGRLSRIPLQFIDIN